MIWNASTDAEILSPEEVPNNDLRYTLVSCCESGFDRPSLDDFKDVFVSRGSDVFQGYKESMNPDPYETQLAYYLQKGWTLYSAHEQAKDDVNPWFTVVFKYNLPCINKVRLAPLLVNVDAPNTACSNSSFTITAKVTNREDARYTTATGVKAQLVYPSGFSIISGTNPQTIGSINWNQTKSATWNVKSNGIFMSGTYTFDIIVWSDNLGVEVDAPENPYHKFYIDLTWCFGLSWRDWIFYQYPTYWPLKDPPPGPLQF